MGMSKAFDTVRCNTLIEDLATILDKADLHLIKLLVEDVTLKVRVGSETSNPFTTKMGVPQGASAKYSSHYTWQKPWKTTRRRKNTHTPRHQQKKTARRPTTTNERSHVLHTTRIWHHHQVKVRGRHWMGKKSQIQDRKGEEHRSPEAEGERPKNNQSKNQRIPGEEEWTRRLEKM